MKMFNLCLFSLAAFLLFSCNSAEQKTTGTDNYQDVLTTSQLYANTIKTVNADSVLAFWADDAKIIGSQDDIVGKDALREFLEALYTGLKVYEIEISNRNLDVSENLAVEDFQYSEVISINDGEKQTLQGKQITVWKKIDEKWKISIVSLIPMTEDTIHSSF